MFIAFANSLAGETAIAASAAAVTSTASLARHASDAARNVAQTTHLALGRAADLALGRPAVAIDPNSKLPGTVQLASLVGGLMTWVLLACVAAVLIGAAAWGFGSRSGHFGATQQGRTMVLGGVAGAMITGAATALVNFGFGIGGAVH